MSKISHQSLVPEDRAETKRASIDYCTGRHIGYHNNSFISCMHAVPKNARKPSSADVASR